MNAVNPLAHKIVRLWWLLRLTYGLLFIVAGVDKFFSLATNWEKYISPFVAAQIPAGISMAQIMMAIGVVEILIGLMILSKWTHIGTYLAAFWLTAITANLLAIGFPYDVAVRDGVMAIGALSLGCLTKLKDIALVTSSS
jgi:uncharacterized membrane protein YphA (DoxX/SURF4 family)